MQKQQESHVNMWLTFLGDTSSKLPTQSPKTRRYYRFNLSTNSIVRARLINYHKYKIVIYACNTLIQLVPYPDCEQPDYHSVTMGINLMLLIIS